MLHYCRKKVCPVAGNPVALQFDVVKKWEDGGLRVA